MPKVSECNLLVGALRYCCPCLLYSHNPHLVCAVHPHGVDSDSCLDFRQETYVEIEEQLEPEGASHYNGELILQPKQHLTV